MSKTQNRPSARMLNSSGLLFDSCVPLPASWTREGDIEIAPPPSIVDPDATEQSRFMHHAANAAVRAATGV